MFLTSFINSIKQKDSFSPNKELSPNTPKRVSDLPETTQDYALASNKYEEAKLNKSYFGKKPLDTTSAADSKDLMAEFVIVDYKEYEPYTTEEWEALISDSDLVSVDQQRLYIVKIYRRKRIWLYLANVDQLKADNAEKGITYQSLLTKECPDRYNIRKDISRTFPDHEFFNHHRKDRLAHLENVLRAYAVFDPQVGYTQGMNFLVGTLIYYMHLERTERDYYVIDRDFESDVFWILVHILQAKDWRSLYVDNTPKLVELLNKLENRISKELPRLHAIFNEYGLIPACFSQCFLTLLFYNSPLRFAKRVLDMFLLVGEDIILELVMKMLTLCQNDILQKREVEELYPFLRSQLVEFTFQKYEKEFSNLVADQNVIQIIEYD